VRPAVAAACELLGFDPLTIANEGKCLVICAPEAAETALAALRAHPYGREAVQIGTVQPARDPHTPRLLVRTPYGTTRIVDTPAGEILPRIC
jgi:hydrogenase expression/formation protein HypE